ncbi:cytochrome P450 [Streptomyces sp. 3MP-14]|uniref:Cytochrome P450 n=1 Tax=Streptomyces mimosae TaxID=2586635 RepID=A0A5N6A697_9ACTN|nr:MULTISPECIES: cytochrome P450 [Streptomyces]KAB8164191.1 cytochrome P450 [Streptomyces mimosae]KAB8176468.1 cytochrome P450 [Streptomyces sp. 3MP-14]
MSCPVHHTADSAGADTIVLDPLVRDLAGEGAALLAAGPIARVELPGGVPVLAVTHHAEARRLLNDPRLVKDINVWNAWQRGEISQEWPLIGLAAPPRSMLTVDGAEHRRLRAKVAQALTPRRVQLLRPGVERITARLLAGLDAQPVGEPVDLKAHFAYPLPMAVVSELMGIKESDQPELRSLFEEFFNTQTPPARVPKMIAELHDIFARTVEEKRADPGDDLTSALILADDGGARLTDDEITNTLQLMIAAGHETTIALINNAVRGLLSNPDQKALVLNGEIPWETVIEETLRWSSPTSHVLIRFATEDVEVGDTVIPKGEGLITSYVAIGWDEKQHGPTAREFDITRPTPIRHMSFGHGPHVCPGAPLSRLEAAVALPALFERFPDIAPAVPDETLRRRPNVTQNDFYELPVLLHGAR